MVEHFAGGEETRGEEGERKEKKREEKGEVLCFLSVTLLALIARAKDAMRPVLQLFAGKKGKEKAWPGWFLAEVTGPPIAVVTSDKARGAREGKKRTRRHEEDLQEEHTDLPEKKKKRGFFLWSPSAWERFLCARYARLNSDRGGKKKKSDLSHCSPKRIVFRETAPRPRRHSQKQQEEKERGGRGGKRGGGGGTPHS